MRNKMNIILLIISLVSSLNYSIAVSTIESDAPDAYLFLTDLDNIVLDGIIEEEEYPDTVAMTDISGTIVNYLSWGHNNTHLAIGLVFNATGWVAIGLGEVGLSMGTADLIMGSVDGNQVIVKDMYTHGVNIPTEDNDTYIQSKFTAGRESSDQTFIEIIIPLQSSDVTGHDHNWSTNNTYGFFTAFNDIDDDFNSKHTLYSRPFTVTVLTITALVIEIQLTMNITESLEPGKLIISALVVGKDDNEPINHLEIGFYRDTLFGKLLYGSAFSNETGFAITEIILDFFGNVTFIALYEGSEFVKRNEISMTSYFEPSTVQSKEDFGDLRDVFNDKYLIRSFLLILLYIIISALFIAFLTVIFDLGQIFRFRNEKNIIRKVDYK